MEAAQSQSAALPTVLHRLMLLSMLHNPKGSERPLILTKGAEGGTLLAEGPPAPYIVMQRGRGIQFFVIDADRAAFSASSCASRFLIFGGLIQAPSLRNLMGWKSNVMWWVSNHKQSLSHLPSLNIK